MGEKFNLLSCTVNIEKSKQYCINENINPFLFIECDKLRIRKRPLTDISPDCHHHFLNAMFEELGERSLMSDLDGTKHTFVMQAIVKFSHFTRV